MRSTRTLEIPFCFNDEDLVVKVEVGREDFNVLSVERDGPGEPIDSDAFKTAIEADAKALEELETKAREAWFDSVVVDDEDPPDLRDDR